MRKIGSREGEVESRRQGRCPGCLSGGRSWEKLRVEDKVRSLGWGKACGWGWEGIRSLNPEPFFEVPRSQTGTIPLSHHPLGKKNFFDGPPLKQISKKRRSEGEGKGDPKKKGKKQQAKNIKEKSDTQRPLGACRNTTDFNTFCWFSVRTAGNKHDHIVTDRKTVVGIYRWVFEWRTDEKEEISDESDFSRHWYGVLVSNGRSVYSLVLFHKEWIIC